MIEGGGGVGEQVFGGDHAVDIDAPVAQQLQGGLEAAAARTNQGDFVDDYRRGIDGHKAVHGGFQDERAPRASHGHSLTEALWRAGSVHGPVVCSDGRSLASKFGGDTGGVGDAELLAMASEVVDARAVAVQDLCDEQAEFAVAEHGYAGITGDADLIENLAGGGERLGEDGALSGESGGHDVQIRFGQRQEFAESSRMLHDAEDGAGGAMAAESACAPLAAAAGKVDLTDDALADERGVLGFHHFTDKFMAGNAAEAVVAALEFEVGVADAARKQANEREAFGTRRARSIAHGDDARGEMDRSHTPSLFNKGVTDRTGKWAVVTGASAGIGVAFAEALAARGMNLVLTARRADRLEELAARLRAERRIAVEVCSADLSVPEGLAAVFAFTEAKGIAVETLVNNAGVGAYGEFEHSDLARQLEMVRLNCGAVVHLTHLYLPQMIARRGGEIVFTASMASFQPTPYIAVYGATKTFDLHFAEALSEEVKGYGIRVCALCPGSTESEFHAIAGVPEEGRRKLAAVGPVVEEAMRALDEGGVVAIPGMKNRWQAALERLVSRRLLRRAAARSLRPPWLRK